MIWSLDLDDFNGQFCGEGKFPLLATIKVSFKFLVTIGLKQTVLSINRVHLIN